MIKDDPVRTMGRDSTDSERNCVHGDHTNHALNTRRKRRKTKGERDKLLDKSRTSSKQQTDKKARLSEKKEVRPKTHRRIVKAGSIPMMKQNISTITTNRLTRRFGLFDKMKTSETVLREISIPDHTLMKTTEDLQKILDLEDSKLQKAVDVTKLKSKRTIRLKSNSIERNQESFSIRNKSASTLYTVTSDSSMDQHADPVMEIDSPKPEFPSEPNFVEITERVEGTLLDKNHFKGRDLVKEIQSRLRTLYKSSSPSPSAATTPQQRIPITAGSFSSETVRRDSSYDAIEVSKSDSETRRSTFSSSILKSSDSSGHRGMKIKGSDKLQSCRQLPLTHTIPRITIDALSDAKHLLRLNDNADAVPERSEGFNRERELRFTDCKTKTQATREALALITNTVENHTEGLERNRFYQSSGHLDFSGHQNGVICDVFDFPVKVLNSKVLSCGPFEAQSHSGHVISSNQNAIAQYAYPRGFEQARFTDNTFGYFEDPLHSYPSVSSKDTTKSTDTYRILRNNDMRYRSIEGIFPGSGDDKRFGIGCDLLDVADIPPSDQIMRPRSPVRRHRKPKTRSPSPLAIYPCRLYSKCD